MAQATFSVRMDDKLKKQFESLCTEFGMNMATAINIFARAVVRERKIPFEITTSEVTLTREKAMQAFMELRAQASKDFPEGLTLNEINAEISKVRKGEPDI